jgi:hypothetical protein
MNIRVFLFKSASCVEQVEICLNFFTGYYDQGLYYDNARLIGLSPAYGIHCCYSILCVHSCKYVDIDPSVIFTVTD